VTVRMVAPILMAFLGLTSPDPLTNKHLN